MHYVHQSAVLSAVLYSSAAAWGAEQHSPALKAPPFGRRLSDTIYKLRPSSAAHEGGVDRCGQARCITKVQKQARERAASQERRALYTLAVFVLGGEGDARILTQVRL